MSENFGIHFAKLSSFQGRPKIAVPFVTGNFRKFKPEFWVEMEALFMNRLPLHVFTVIAHYSNFVRSQGFVTVFYVKKLQLKVFM